MYTMHLADRKTDEQRGRHGTMYMAASQREGRISKHCSHPVDCRRWHVTQEWNSLGERFWSIKVDVANLLCGWVQPVEFLRAEVDDECCRWDKTLSRRYQHCTTVSWQVGSLDLSITARTVTPEQVTVTVINDIIGQRTTATSTVHCTLDYYA